MDWLLVLLLLLVLVFMAWLFNSSFLLVTLFSFKSNDELLFSFVLEICMGDEEEEDEGDVLVREEIAESLFMGLCIK
jgi:hypothetical protein